MPIPILLGGLLVASGLFGVVGHAVSKQTNEEAQGIIDRADRKYNESKSLFEETKDETADLLADYGLFKIEVCSGTIKDYIDITNRLSSKNNKILSKNIYYQKYNLNQNDLLTRENYSEIELSSMKSSEIIAGGSVSIGLGALVSMGTYGGVSMLATASTGTAISSLSGIAASNATMAWLGGGSLAAGGLGMAGGAAILGGVAIGPAILISTIFAGVKSEENLENAKLYRKEVNLKVAEIDRIIAILEAIQLRSKEGIRVLSTFNDSLKEKMRAYEDVVKKQVVINNISFLDKLIDKVKTAFISDYNSIYKLSEEDEKVVFITELLVKKIYEVINTPLIDEEGLFTKEFNLLIKEENVEHILNIVK